MGRKYIIELKLLKKLPVGTNGQSEIKNNIISIFHYQK